MMAAQFAVGAVQAGSPTEVENFVTAENGQLTYRVIAYRKMEDGELQRVAD